LLLGSFGPVVIVGVIGAVIAVLRFVESKDRFGVFMVTMAVLFAMAFSVGPTGRLWNARFLPFWYLWMSLLAGYAVARMGAFVDDIRIEHARGRQIVSPWRARMVAPFALLVLVGIFWD